ncbi:hypothetical protein RRG08_019787 [Elysia crispata]|uniref:Uncharacterized protein n=1 Tax=Elysia crispata TaxID=231223 RepID=A0AAE1AW79_9GAST|nr:hypothetical protein RRG08_019787 [Elysia crispata]
MLATVLPTTTMENITSLDTALLLGMGGAGNRIAHNNHGEHHVTRYGALVGDEGCWQPYCPQQPRRTSRH